MSFPKLAMMSSNNMRENPTYNPYFPVVQENPTNDMPYLLQNMNNPMTVLSSAANNMFTPDYAAPLQENQHQINNAVIAYEEEINDDDDDDDEDYIKNFPLGYRFEPTDEELINDYLKKKIDNHKFSRNIIKEVDLYGYNPEELIGKYGRDGEKEWHFFTSRKKKYLGGNRADRRAGDGFWRPLNIPQEIISSRSSDCDKNDQIVIGYRTSLRYFRGKFPNGIGTDWLMKEYTVKDAPRHVAKSQSDMKLDDWVVCKVYMSPSCKRKNKDSANENDRRSNKRSKKKNNNHEVELAASFVNHDYYYYEHHPSNNNGNKNQEAASATANHVDDHHHPISTADSSHNINAAADAAATEDRIQELDQATISYYTNSYNNSHAINNDDDMNNLDDNEAHPETIRESDEAYQPMGNDDTHNWLCSVIVL